ncbi:MAG: hypothetical protein WCG51_07570, partial [Elusimicrobiota bacterium]
MLKPHPHGVGLLLPGGRLRDKFNLVSRLVESCGKFRVLGQRGVGKTTVARLLAKAVNCLAETGKPCGKCSNCVAISENRFIDLIEIDAASNRGIDEIRQLRDKIQFSP